MALQAGANEDAVALLDTAAKLYGQTGREPEQALTAAPAAAALGRLGRGREAIEQITVALQTLAAGEGPDTDLARLNEALGRELVFAGDSARAGPALERALSIAQAHELTDVLAEALNDKAGVYELTGRPQEAEALYSAAVRTAERHDLADALARAQNNLANLGMVWDWPTAREHTEAALALVRRRGNRYNESIGVGNLMAIHLLAGRWEELERLEGELIDADPDHPGVEFIHYRLAFMHALRGDPEAATTSLERLAAWAGSDDFDIRFMHDASVIAVRLAQGRAQEALTLALNLLPATIETFGPTHDTFRDAWPEGLAAALQAGRTEDMRKLIDLIAGRPRGHIPPYLRAQLARCSALLAAAEGNHGMVEQELTDAVAMFAGLAYPHWHAVTQTDLAIWLTGQGRGPEAAPLVDEAVATLTRLRAAPALERAQELSRTTAAHAPS